MNKVTASSLLLVLQKGAERSLGIISTLFLARLLTPEDFGVIAIAMLVLWFVETLSSAGTDVYIIQKENVTDEEVNSAWTLDLILKFMSFILLCISAPIISSYRDNDALLLVIIAIGFILPINAFKNPGLWILRREQNYKAIVKVSVFTKLCTLFVIIPLAYYWQSFWAIVAGQVASALLGMVLSYKISNYRPRICRSQIFVQWRFSKWLIPQSVLGYFRIHIDTLIIGNRFMESELGAYNNLKYFASIPMLQIITPLSAPLHAELGKVHQNCSEMLFQSSIAIKLLSFVAAPFAAISFVASKEIVRLVLGEQWVEYHNIFGYFGLMIIPFILFTQASRILMVKRRTRVIFIYELISTILISTLLISASNQSVDQFAVFRVFGELVMTTLFFIFANKSTFGVFGLNAYSVLIFCASICTLCLYLLKIEFSAFSSTFWYLPFVGFSGVFISGLIGAIWYFWIASDRERKAVGKYSPFKY